MLLEWIASVAQIIVIDIVLSGDNAVVIAMAAHKLPLAQRQRAIMWGGGIAIFLRIVFTLVMAFLLMVPGVRLVGGLMLVWIACKLLIGEEEEHEVSADDADRSALAAIRMIFVADFVMSLDNMLAVAGASGEDWKKLLMGLLISIGIIMTCSALIARLMNRYKWIVYVGAAILAFTAGEMILGDRELAGYIVRNHGVCLDKDWDEQFMESHTPLKSFRGTEGLSEELREVVNFQNGKLTYIGQMNEDHRDALKELVTTEADAEAVDKLFALSHHRPVPDWVPEFLRDRAANWFQRKWPAADHQRIGTAHHHYVAWIFYGLVIAFCMGVPRLFRKPGAGPEKTGEPQPPAEA